MAKQLKKWNGRYNDSAGVYNHVNIAAYTQKEALEMLRTLKCTGSNEIREYFSDCWGNTMDGIVPEAPGVWLETKFKGNVVKVI